MNVFAPQQLPGRKRNVTNM